MAGLSQGAFPAADEPPVAGCAKLAAEYDWSESELGPQDEWDPAVEAVVRTLLEATAPMAYCHDPGLAMVYNDRFADLLGVRHPRAWAQRASVVMPEIWSRPGYPAAVDNVFAGGPSFHDAGELLDLSGRSPSHPDWAYLARSYSAVRDSVGSVLGILVVVVEIAPVLVLVSRSDQGDQGAPRWHGMELWDETVAQQPLVWSGFRAGTRSPAAAVREGDQRFVAEGPGHLVLPINGPDIAGSIGYLGAPRHLPDVQMVTLAARDQNGTPETARSGEFYDVIGMPDGRLAITIGEVMGAGIASAAVMAQIRVSLRGSALSSSDPNVIFTALDELVSHLDRTWPAGNGHGSALPAEPSSSESTRSGNGKGECADNVGLGGELFVTALLGIFDPATGDLQLASAGHLPPAVVRRPAAGQAHADGSEPLAEYAELELGPPLGMTGARPVIQLVLHGGDALVGFTRGLFERQDQSITTGQARLLATLSTMPATAPRSISQYVVDRLIGDRGLEHDCALLVVVRDDQAHQMTSVLVPPHTIAVRGARRWASAQLESWGVSEDIVADTVLCVSELVTNVVLHAGTPARVTMELADRLLVTVEDTGSWSAPRTGPKDPTAQQGRGLPLVAALADAMGHARRFDGSTVWFEMTRDPKPK